MAFVDCVTLWIASEPSTLKTIIANHVAEIQTLQWHYIL